MTDLTAKQLSVLVEKVETLDGSRGRAALAKAAVRLQDLSGLLEVTTIQAQTVASAPTAADFNRLLADVAAIASALRVVATALQARSS